MRDLALVLALGLTVLAPLAVLWRVVCARRHFGGVAEQATFAALHTASLAAPALRAGLSSDSASRAVSHLRTLLGSPAVAITDLTDVLAWDGSGAHHRSGVMQLAAPALERGRTSVATRRDEACSHPSCDLRSAVVAPLLVEDRVVGSLTAYAAHTDAGLTRAVGEVARWVSTQLELAELDRTRTRAAEAEVRAMRAQISPHFVYNALTTIASFVRTDPERARELLLDFADFTRYSFRRHGSFTTLAEELRSIDQYLVLERARFGDRLQVTLQVAPEVLPVAVPFLCLQPLVENAVRHGLEGRTGGGHVSIVADDLGSECRIAVEDDGVGIDPEQVRRVLAGRPDGDSVGLGNVDERLRAVFGDDHGLTVETALGAGTKVSLRVPKYKVGVRAS